MKRLSILLASGIVALAAPVLALVNSTDPGLPPTWNTAADRGYGSGVAMTVNNASGMCVECHYVNPSARIAAPTGGRAATTDLGTHTVMNQWNGVSAAVGMSNSGGGFAGGTTADGAQPRDAGGFYMAKGAWTVGTESGGVSKYGTGAAFVSVAATAVSGWGTATPDMLCESCHNVLVNTGDQLILGTYNNAGDDSFCVGCHGARAAARGNTYADFHANGNMRGFDANTATDRKRHHVLRNGTEIDQIQYARYNPDGDPASTDSVTWAPNFSNLVAASWCGAGKYNTAVTAVAIPEADPIHFRNECNVAGSGTYSTALVTGDIFTTTNVQCTSCHRPHNANTGGGAFILREGVGVAAADKIPGAIGATLDQAYGIKRQNEAGTHPQTTVYGEYVKLCAGCHQGYGN